MLATCPSLLNTVSGNSFYPSGGRISEWWKLDKWLHSISNGNSYFARILSASCIMNQGAKRLFSFRGMTTAISLKSERNVRLLATRPAWGSYQWLTWRLPKIPFNIEWSVNPTPSFRHFHLKLVIEILRAVEYIIWFDSFFSNHAARISSSDDLPIDHLQSSAFILLVENTSSVFNCHSI